MCGNLPYVNKKLRSAGACSRFRRVSLSSITLRSYLPPPLPMQSGGKPPHSKRDSVIESGSALPLSPQLFRGSELAAVAGLLPLSPHATQLDTAPITFAPTVADAKRRQAAALQRGSGYRAQGPARRHTSLLRLPPQLFRGSELQLRQKNRRAQRLPFAVQFPRVLA
jgi:hypothetical protein